MQRMMRTPVVPSEMEHWLAEEWAGRDIEEGNVQIPFPEERRVVFFSHYCVDLVVSIVLYVLASVWSVRTVRTTCC
jgi:hypothetical protein